MTTVHAIYENGVFRPLEQVDLPDQTAVEFEPRPVPASAATEAEREAARKRIWEILSMEFDGKPNLAARHNEHQP